MLAKSRAVWAPSAWGLGESDDDDDEEEVSGGGAGGGGGGAGAGGGGLMEALDAETRSEEAGMSALLEEDMKWRRRLNMDNKY